MNSVASYIIGDVNNGKCNKDNIVLGKNYRFSILTDRLVRLEYSSSGKFEDRPSQRVIYRNFPKVNFTVAKSETLIQVVTSYFTINYVMEKNFASSKFSLSGNLKISLNGTDRGWYYGHPEARNYGTINYSLDDFKGKLKYSKGLYSTDGFAVIDDSDTLVLDSNNKFVKRNEGNVDLYVFMYKKELGACLQDYYKLTGYPSLLPRYAFGNWWHRDLQYTSKDVLDVVKKFNEEDIPLSIFLLGNKWHNDIERYTIDPNIINMQSLAPVLKKYNTKIGLTIRPDDAVSTNSGYYKYLNPGSGQSASFIPMDNNKLNLYTANIINGFNNLGFEIHNVDYNNVKDKNTMALISQFHQSMPEMSNGMRSVVLTRNHNIAVHRGEVITTGKTMVDWNTLNVLPRYNASASNIGVSYMANAIGGYYKGIEDFELYLRYIQLGVFSSILLLSSDEGKYYRREPWKWDISQRKIISKYLNLRNKLIPYIYTEAYIYHESGSPLIQPLYYKYPKIYDEPLYLNQYFFGSQLLVCPITKPKNIIMNRVVQRMFIPEGVWYELESGKKYIGNKYYMSFYKDEDYPVFCREGSIMVMSLDKDTNSPTNMEISVYPGKNGEYKLYEDDGFTTNYKNNNYQFITNYEFSYEKDKHKLSITPEGVQGIVPDFRNYTVRFKNTNTCSVSITNGSGKSVPATASLDNNDLVITIPNVSSVEKIVVACSGSNLENSTMKLINDDIKGILEDLAIETILKEKIDNILFSDLPIRKKRIEIRKLKRKKLEPKFIKMFLKLLEYIQTV